MNFKENNKLIVKKAKVFVDENIKSESQESSFRIKNNEELNEGAVSKISGIISGKGKEEYIYNELTGEDEVYDACFVICKKSGIEIAPVSDIKKTMKDFIDVSDIARISKFPIRSVVLDNKWWKNDNGAILAYTIDLLHLFPKTPVNIWFMILEIRLFMN